MFTGIIKAVGTIDKIEPSEGDLRLSVRSDGLPWLDFNVGDSISVNGVCLTAVRLSSSGFLADVSVETMNVTALSDLKQGNRVNLEPALAVGDRLGGHFVSGHVDCVGIVKSRDGNARSVKLEIEIPQDFRRYMARKGSVCIDGVSLTINEVSASGIEVNIIPHTADVTIIGDYRTGSNVNIEVDLLSRYLERLLSGEHESAISLEFMKTHGFA